MTPVSPSPARALSLVARYNWLSSVVLDYDKSTGREGGWLGYCSRGSHRPGVSCTAELGVDSSGINVIPLTDWPACSMSWAPAGRRCLRSPRFVRKLAQLYVVKFVNTCC